MEIKAYSLVNEYIHKMYWPLTPCPKDERSDNSFNSLTTSEAITTLTTKIEFAKPKIFTIFVKIFKFTPYEKTFIPPLAACRPARLMHQRTRHNHQWSQFPRCSHHSSQHPQLRCYQDHQRSRSAPAHHPHPGSPLMGERTTHQILCRHDPRKGGSRSGTGWRLQQAQCTGSPCPHGLHLRKDQIRLLPGPSH